ncbi:MAG TPA: hypothetical protein VGQ59_20185 [Cyclobacteriaceae bacterium]|jgi:hypothetical protein|nr:hypothetical protein [Cyclobacteriaceae bacterium]
MPKLIDYPAASFMKAMELANAVEYLGGSCTIQSCADRLGKKVSGGFGMLISSAIKFNLVTRKGEELKSTQLYKNIKLAYNEEEKNENLRSSFFSPRLFSNLYDRFKGRELPISMLPKLLIREFNVDEEAGSRISGYFVEGLRYLNLLDGNKLMDINNGRTSVVEEIDTVEENTSAPILNQDTNVIPVIPQQAQEVLSLNNSVYTIHLKGPGMDSKITISEEEDFLILEAMVKKIKRKMNELGKE